MCGRRRGQLTHMERYADVCATGCLVARQLGDLAAGGGSAAPRGPTHVLAGMLPADAHAAVPGLAHAGGVTRSRSTPQLAPSWTAIDKITPGAPPEAEGGSAKQR